MPDLIAELRRYGDAVEQAASEARGDNQIDADRTGDARPTRPVLWVAAAVVVVVCAVGALVVVNAGDDPDGRVITEQPPDPSVPPTTEPQPAPVPGGQPADVVDEGNGWRRFAAAPLALEAGSNGVGREGTSTVWTGRELIAWGGDVDGGPTYDDGAALDPDAASWRALPDGPLSPRAHHVAVWTGDEMVIWGGIDRSVDPEAPTELTDGAAFDPVANRWRPLADGPLTGGANYAAVWTGTEMIVVGGTSGTYVGTGQVPPVRRNEAAAYEPSTDSWRRLPDLPVDLSFLDAHWTGDEVIVTGGQAFNNPSFQNFRGDVLGAVLDPATDTWRELPPSGLSAQSATTAWHDGVLYAYTYQPDLDGARAWIRETGTWEDRPAAPTGGCEDLPVATAYPDGVIVSLCGVTAAYSPADGTWSDVTPPASGGDSFYGLTGRAVWTGREILSPVSDGTVFAYRP